jgi:hypothetical protein
MRSFSRHGGQLVLQILDPPEQPLVLLRQLPDGLVPLGHVLTEGLLGLGLGLPVVLGVVELEGHLLQLAGQRLLLLRAGIQGLIALLPGLPDLVLQPGGGLLGLLLGALDILHHILPVKPGQGAAKNMVVHGCFPLSCVVFHFTTKFSL